MRGLWILVALMALTLAASVGEGSSAWGADDGVFLCDYWPLGVGNRWVEYLETGDVRYSMEVTDFFFVNGFGVWKLRLIPSGWQPPDHYWVIMDGWLYATSDPNDLTSLPAVTGDLGRFLPAEYKIGETIEVGSGTPLILTSRRGSLSSLLAGTGLTVDMFPLGEQQDVLGLFFTDGRPLFLLGRGLGLLGGGTDIMDEVTVVQGCAADFTLSVIPSGGWFEEGKGLELTAHAGAKGGSTYQWKKDGVALAEATDSSYTVDALSLADSGRYACVVAADETGTVETPRVTVTVFKAGALPAAGLGGLFLLLLLCVLLGGRTAAFRKAK